MSHRYQTLDFSIEKEEFKSVPLSTISPSSNTLTLLKEILLNLQLSSFLQVLLDPYMIWFLFMLILSFLPFASILSLKLFLLLPFFLLLIIKQLKTFISFRSQLQFQSRINSQGVALSSAQAFSVRESKNIHQGDFFVIRKNEVSPCDCFILFIDNDSENCFVRKQDLDNPEELEKRSPVKETSEIIENEGLNLEILRNSIESLQVRTSPGSSLKELAGFIGIRSHSELIQVSYFNMVHSGDVVLECEWILCIAVSVGRETQCWIDYEFNLAKCQGSHFYHVRRTQFKSLVFIVFCIVLNAGLSRGSEKNGSVIESVFFSLVIFGFNLPVCIYLIFEIVEILNFCIVRKKFKDISVNSSQSLSKLAAVEYVLSEKVGVVSKRMVDVVFCIVSGTVYQETLLENEEEPLKLFSSFSTKKIRNSLNFCSFYQLQEELSVESYISKKWIFCISLAVCNSFQSKTSLSCINSIDKAAQNLSKKIGVEIVSRLGKTFVLIFNKCEYSFTTLIHEVLKAFSQVILLKDETSEVYYLVYKTINPDENSQTSQIFQDLDKTFPNQSKLLYFYLKIHQEDVKSLLFDYESAKKSQINQEQRLISVFSPFITRCKILGVLGFESTVPEETITSIKNIQKAGINFFLVSSTSEASILSTCHLLGMIKDLPVIHLNQFHTAAQAYTEMAVVLKRNLFEHSSKRRDSCQRDTEITGRVFMNRSEVVHPLMFDLGYLRKDLKIPKKVEKVEKFFISVSGEALDLVSRSKESIKAFVYLLFAAKGAAFYEMKPQHKKMLVSILQNGLGFEPVVMSVGCCDGASKMIAQADVGVKVLDEKNSNTFYSDISLKSFSSLEKLLLNLGFRISFQYRFISELQLFKTLSTVFLLFFFQSFCDFSSCAIIDYDLLVTSDLLISFLLILGASYFLNPSNELKSEFRRSAKVKTIFLDLSLLKQVFLAIFNSGIIVLITSQVFKAGLSSKGQAVDRETLSLVLFLSLQIALFIQVLFYPVYQKGFIFLCFAFFGILFLVVFQVFYGKLEKDYKSFEDSADFPCFWIVLGLTSGFMFVFTYGFMFCWGILQRNGNQSRFEEFRERFHLVFSDSLHWRFTGNLKKLNLDRWKLQFDDFRQEAEYRLKDYRRMRIVLRLYLGGFFIIQLLNISMEFAGKAVFLKIGNFSFLLGGLILILFLLSLFARTSKIRLIEPAFFGLLISLSILKPLLDSTISSIPRYPIYTIIFVLDLNLNWRMTILKSLILYSVSIFALIYESLSTDPSGLPAKLSIWSLTSFFTTLLILFTSNLKDFHRRKEFHFQTKLSTELEKSSKILSYFLPDFIKLKSKDGINYVAEDKGTISVIYCEIFQFSSLLQENDPSDLCPIFDHLSKRLDFLSESCGVIKIQNNENHFLACAGLKDSEVLLDSSTLKVTHARRAVEFALAIIKEVEKSTLPGGKKVSLKIGIHSGPVIAGVVGSFKPELVLLGETVKIAKVLARTLIEVDSVQLSMNTFELLSDVQGLAFKESRVDFKRWVMDTKIVNYPSLNYDLDSLDDVYIRFIRRKSSFAALSLTSSRQNEQISESDTQQVRRFRTDDSRLKIFSRKSLKYLQDFVYPNNFKLTLASLCRCTQEEKDFAQEYMTEIKECQMAGLFISLFCDFLLIICELALVLSQVKYSSYSRLVIIFTIEILMIFFYFFQKRYNLRRLLCFLLSFLYSLQFLSLLISSTVTGEHNLLYLIYYYYKYCLLCFFTGISFSKSLYFQLVLAFIWLVDLFKNYPDYQSTVYTFAYFCCNLALTYRQEVNMRNNLALKALFKQELQKTHQNLLQTLPPITSELEKISKNLEKISDVPLLQVKILGFREWAELRKPAEVIEVLSEVFSLFDQLCSQHSVYKVSTQGEKYFVIGYVSDKNRRTDEEVRNLANFAWALGKSVESVNEKFFTQFNVRVGIHLGQVFARAEGEKVVKFQVYGNDVEICKKVQRVGRDGKISVSSRVMRVLEMDQRIRFEEIGDLEFGEDGLSTFFMWKDEEVKGFEV